MNEELLKIDGGKADNLSLLKKAQALANENMLLKERIKTLKDGIRAFKEYDTRRKKHYASAMQRLGEMESLVEEYTDKGYIPDQYVKLKKTASELSRRIEYYGIPEVEKSQYDKAESLIRIENMKRERLSLIGKMKRLKAENSQLQAEIRGLRIKS